MPKQPGCVITLQGKFAVPRNTVRNFKKLLPDDAYHVGDALRTQQGQIRAAPGRPGNAVSWRGGLPPLLGRRRVREGLLSPCPGEERIHSRGWGGKGELALVEQARWHVARALKLNPTSFSSLYSAALADVLAHRWRSGAALAAAALGVMTGRGVHTRAPVSPSFRRPMHRQVASPTSSPVASSAAPAGPSVRGVSLRAPTRPSVAAASFPACAVLRAAIERTARRRSCFPSVPAQAAPAALGHSGHLPVCVSGVHEVVEKDAMWGHLALAETQGGGNHSRQGTDGATTVPPVSQAPLLGPSAFAHWRFRRRVSKRSPSVSGARALLALLEGFDRQRETKKQTACELPNLRQSPSRCQVYAELKLLHVRCCLLSGRPVECLRSLCGLLDTASAAQTAGAAGPSARVDWRTVVEEGLLLGAQSVCELLSETARRLQTRAAGEAGNNSPFFAMDWPLLEKIQENLGVCERSSEADVARMHAAPSTDHDSTDEARASPEVVSRSPLSPNVPSAVPSSSSSRASSTAHCETRAVTWADSATVADAVAVVAFNLPRTAPGAPLDDADLERLRQLSAWSSLAFKACFQGAFKRGDVDRMAAAAAWRARGFLQLRQWDDAVREATQALAIDIWTPAEVFASPPPGFLSSPSPEGQSHPNSGSHAGLPLLSLFSPLHIRAAAHALAGRGKEAAADFALSRCLMRLPGLEARPSGRSRGLGNRTSLDDRHEKAANCRLAKIFAEPHKAADDEPLDAEAGREVGAVACKSRHEADTGASQDERGSRESGACKNQVRTRLLNPREPAVRWDRTPLEKARLKSRAENPSRVFFGF
ncbi:conserved hypothetical protein [Neospora caninum Liverpool]|uniref:Uncharacterized protein n=1 Tax=Neospora caninum (strain Liverpool) TaxID=572307 RepID=F0V9B4_NEOCL|nr:conserved hypothetical protein [Neospora caninum Liverpool]CBZ50339.1 conserved hypothetical protein [Neospora caninum Liverpool]|eukprot:XP_003880373.1 conserved hypothetical protein [Neospora caninum Liverpool]